MNRHQWHSDRGPFKCYVTRRAGRVSDFPEKIVTKMYCSTLLSLRRGVGVEFPEKNVT